MSDFLVVIPARYASARLPGKPLLDIVGKPMIERVWDQACKSDASRVVIATDDARIESLCQAFGAEVCMTRVDHESGTDRLQEVAEKLGMADDAIMVNVQGDEPLIPPAVINQVARNMAEHPEAGIATLAETIDAREIVLDPNAVKVVCDTRGMALYFSRAPIPWYRDHYDSEGDSVAPNTRRHIGIYAYRANFLHQFVQWPMGQLEQLEKLEQLRAMENGVAIHVDTACEEVPAGVDTQVDLDAVRELIAE